MTIQDSPIVEASIKDHDKIRTTANRNTWPECKDNRKSFASDVISEDTNRQNVGRDIVKTVALLERVEAADLA